MTAVAEIASAGKVSVVLLAALIFWMLLVPARAREGALPAPAAVVSAALAVATTSPLNCTLPPAATFCTVTFPPRVNPPTMLTGPTSLKSTTEPAAATTLVLGKATGPVGVVRARETNWKPLTVVSLPLRPLRVMRIWPLALAVRLVNSVETYCSSG